MSDAAIDNGMPPEQAAGRILEAVAAGQRELLLAEGMERDVALMRRQDPEALFERMSALTREGYAQKMAAEAEKS